VNRCAPTYAPSLRYRIDSPRVAEWRVGELSERWAHLYPAHEASCCCTIPRARENHNASCDRRELMQVHSVTRLVA